MRIKKGEMRIMKGEIEDKGEMGRNTRIKKGEMKIRKGELRRNEEK